MSTSSLKILCRYQYDPLDRLTGVGLLERASTQRFYQEYHLTTELGEQTQRTIIRHEARPLAQQQSTAGVTESRLFASDQAHSVLHTLAQTNPQQLTYTAYGHHPAESGLSRVLGFNGECPDAITGHYLLGQGTRSFNPVLMRFNSPDELSPFGKGGINPYTYCGGDPINFSDPTGNVKFAIFLTRTARTSVIVPNPMYRLHPSSHSIARAARSASTSTTIVDVTTPIAATPVTASVPQPRPSTSTPVSGEQPFHGVLTNTSLSISEYPLIVEPLNAGREFDSYLPHHPDFQPMVTRELQSQWNEASNLLQASPSPKANIKLQLTELKIKTSNIRDLRKHVVTKSESSTTRPF
jgi:RHS repeat-associated protein